MTRNSISQSYTHAQMYSLNSKGHSRHSKLRKFKPWTFFIILLFIFTGECWSGPEAGGTYGADGPSNECKAKDWDVCDPAVHHSCVGKAKTNAVYSI